MNTDQVLPAAVIAVVVILVIVGLARIVMRRRGPNEDTFGAGGTGEVQPGTRGVTKTALSPSGVVLAAGEQWTARSGSGATIASGQPVRIVGQDGLTLIVDAEPAASKAGE
jgi:membrane-bound ClpP family serine protease